MVLKELGVRGTDTTFHHSTKRDRVVFVDDVPPGLVCPACRDAFVCPMIAPCGHSVCKACSEKVNRATGRCFTCDAPANPVDLDDDGVSAVELGDVRALCRHGVGVREGEAGPEVYVRHDEFNVTACSAGVRLRDLETHEAACQFRPLRCDLRDVVHRDEDGAVVDDVDAVDNKENVVDGWGAGGANDNNNGGYHEDACGAVCLLRDMPAHRAECKNRLVNCPFASAGCEWRGAARRLSDHRNHCRRQPRECPNGCGAMVSVGAMMMKHLERCKLAEVACDAPDAEWDDAVREETRLLPIRPSFRGGRRSLRSYFPRPSPVASLHPRCFPFDVRPRLPLSTATPPFN
jgi:TNF receptor-associated factor 4